MGGTACSWGGYQCLTQLLLVVGVGISVLLSYCLELGWVSVSYSVTACSWGRYQCLTQLLLVVGVGISVLLSYCLELGWVSVSYSVTA